MDAVDIIVYRNLAIVVLIVAALQCLGVTLCREWIKSDLRRRRCEPHRIRWQPFAWRTNLLTCSFRVVYSDFRGHVHRASCWTYWHRPRVTWATDEIIDATGNTSAEQ